VWPEQELPAPKLLDRVLLLLNLMPIAISAAARGCLWLLEINMAGFPFCSQARHVNWADHLRGAPESKSDELTDEERLERVKSALVERRASQFPHAGARAFTYHIAGVANMLGAWEQPFDICLGGLLHSVYSTEMFPWRLYKPVERPRLVELAGARVEHLVFMYCTCSQQELYKEVNGLSERKKSLSAGLAVRNFYTGERTVLDARQAAHLLVILAADLMEQEPFFSLHLPCACLRLAGPHLEVPPPLWLRLEETGFYELTKPRLEEIQSNAISLLRRSAKWGGKNDGAGEHMIARAAHQRLLEDAAKTAPWLYELSVEAVRLGSGKVPLETHKWCKSWGTRWSCVCGPQSALEYTSLGASIRQNLPHENVPHKASTHSLPQPRNRSKLPAARGTSPAARVRSSAVRGKTPERRETDTSEVSTSPRRTRSRA